MDRPAWLAARRNGVTASEVSRLGKYKTAAARKKCYGTLADEKIEASDDDWKGQRMDRYRQWGKEREPVLEEWANFAFGFTPESRLAFSATDRQHLASVDGWKVDDRGVHLAEFKTTNKPLSWDLADEKGYVDQCQWQMWVTDAVDDLILWEMRLDDPDSDGFLPGERGTLLIVRDDQRIAELVSFATEFLIVLMQRMVGDDGSVDDPMLDDIVTRLQDAKAAAAELDPQVRHMMSSSGMTSAKTAHWMVSYEAGSAKDVLDTVSFAKAHPLEARRVIEIAAERAALHRDELAAIMELQTKFTKKGDPPNPTLRITARKDAKDAPE
jgi:hypothetical protein